MEFILLDYFALADGFEHVCKLGSALTAELFD